MGIGIWQLVVLALVVAIVAAFAFRASRMGVKSSDEE